jgi:acyl carrier protein
MKLLERVARLLAPHENEAKVSAADTTVASEPGAPTERRESLILALRQHLALKSAGRLSLEGIDPEAQMFDRGYLDSFSYVEFLAFIEETYRVRIDDSQLAGHLSTIAAMANHILESESGRPS